MKFKTTVFLLFLFITQSVLADFMCEDATNYYAVYEKNTYTCSAGQYLPANADGCVSCLYGYTCQGGNYTFNENEDSGIVINTYTCNSGQYLPANTLGCVSCPNGFNCPGGTFVFNPDEYQGLEITSVPNNTMNNICADNFPDNLFAIYEHNQHTCAQGYYLPANVDACTICPLNNKCVGGNLTFNETTDQGIESCPNGTFAPTGSSVCYPHVLHVGNDVVYMKSVKTTTPSLNTKINNEIFYANMTTTPTYMNKDSNHYFKTIYNDTVYYICDDTTLR